MKTIHRILAALLAVLMLFTFAACTNSNGGDETTEATAETTLPVADEVPSYTVKVVDEAGNPVAGAMVQICSENCYPNSTNAEGIATYNVVEDEYKVSFINIPAGYELASEQTEFYFEEGSNEIVITLKAVA